MAKTRKKKRTHVPAAPPVKPGAGSRPPKSMVIRMGAGEIGHSISQLALDFRSMMEPDTASRLKERKSNKLKDYTAMAGPLGVTHLFLFSRSKSGNLHLRVALTPRGPTLTFRVDKYILSKDIAKSQKHPRGGGKEFLTAPLLVMNNFTTPANTQGGSADQENQDPIKKQLEALTTTVFQSIFPPISPQTTPLSSIRRILLLNREVSKDGTYVLNLRHYAITTRRTGISKRVRRFDPKEQSRARDKSSKPLPNLGRLQDAADYLLDPASGGYTSASETELDTDAEVEVVETQARKVLNKKEREKLRAKHQQKQKDGDDVDQEQEGDGNDDDYEDEEGEEARSRALPEPPQPNVEKRAVKLVELGPRMKLRMVKVEEGICEGRVMWNEFVTKTKDEQKELDVKWDVRRKEKEERKKVQRENIERKKQLKKNTKSNAGETGDDVDDDDDEEDWDSDELDALADQDDEEMNGVEDQDDDEAMEG